MKIEMATVADAEEILKIYSHYVLNTAATFEFDPPTIEEFRGRIEEVLTKFPYLKAVDDNGVILGFAYAHHLRDRRAYDRSVETTIYVNPTNVHHGVGKALYDDLENKLKSMGILNMYACVAVPKTDYDPYLTWASPSFHKKMGFTLAGTLKCSGRKFDRWYDMTWMEKIIGVHGNDPMPVEFGKYSV